jgi:hypothetical protein
MGIPINGHANVFCISGLVVTNTTILKSTLKMET